MQKTTLDFIISIINEQPEMRFFRIADQNDNVVYDQQNESATNTTAIESLKNFFKHNEGIYTITLRNKRIKTGNGYREMGAYTVVNNSEYPKAYINGVDEDKNHLQTNFNSQFGGSTDINNLIAMIQQKDAKIQELIHQNFISLMDEKNKQFDLKLEMLKKETANPNASFDAAALQAITGMFGGGLSTGINGIGDPVISAGGITTKERLNKAIQTLLSIDPNFVSNIEKLSVLAQTKPEIYKMAINQLNSL